MNKILVFEVIVFLCGCCLHSHACVFFIKFINAMVEYFVHYVFFFLKKKKIIFDKMDGRARNVRIQSALLLLMTRVRFQRLE